MIIEASRLQLRSLSAGDLVALFEGVDQFQERMGLRVADGLRDFYVSGEVSPEWMDRLRSEQGAERPWVHGFGVVEKEHETIVGSAGFKGPPTDEGVVEIAYAIVPSREGRGYATEAAQALVSFAFGDPRVNLVRAHTLPTPNASTRVLTKCRFSKVGEIVDPDDGLVWRWERVK